MLGHTNIATDTHVSGGIEMLHKALSDVIDGCTDTQWIVVIECDKIIHFHESLDSLHGEGHGHFVSLVQIDDEVAVFSSNDGYERHDVDDVGSYLLDNLFWLFSSSLHLGQTSWSSERYEHTIR